MREMEEPQNYQGRVDVAFSGTMCEGVRLNVQPGCVRRREEYVNR